MRSDTAPAAFVQITLGRSVIGVLILAITLGIAWAIIAVGPGIANAAMHQLSRSPSAASPPWSETVFTAVIFGGLIVAALVFGLIDRRRVVTVGDRPGMMLGAGLAIGFAGITVTMLYAKLAGTLVPGAALRPSVVLLLWGMGVVALQTASEEIYFRGWLQPALGTRWGMPAAIVVSALAFALLHVVGGARAPVSLVNLALGGLMFGLLAVQGRGLATAIGAHFAWNGAEQLIYGLDPNPGIGSFGAVTDQELVGSPLWGGSTEGLNASLGMTFVLIAIIVPLATMVLRHKSGRVVQPRAAAVTSMVSPG